ncbi:MAG: LpqB family beta-propeller domain-containing protein [Blastocatellia bacterium]
MSLPTKHFHEFGPFRIDLTERVLYRDGSPVALPPKTFDTLAALVARSGHIVEKDELIRKVWPDTFVEEVNLARHVSNLRKVLGEEGDDNLYIETVPRRGYRFVAKVRAVPMEAVEIDDGEELVVEMHSLSHIVTNEEEVVEPEAIEIGRQPVAALSEGALAPPAWVKRRKWAALALVAMVVAIGFGLYRWLDRSPARAPVRPNIVPFASLPGREGEPDFSPDGNQLAFTWDGGEGGQTDIYVKLIGTGTPLRLTHDPADEVSPVWSPDGRHIAFVRAGMTQNQVLIVPALGGPERKLLSGGKPITRLTWSPDGKWLAMADAQDNPNKQRIVMVSVETGEKRPLTTPPMSFNDYRPAFSPDGRQLAFVRDYDLYLTAVSGGGEKRLTTGSRGIDGVAWTADGREIIFDSGRAGNRTLWRVPAAGGEPVALFSGGSIYSRPAVSRQGQRLAFIERYLDSNIRRLELPAVAKTGRGVAINWDTMTRFAALYSIRAEYEQHYADGELSVTRRVAAPHAVAG